MAAVVATPLVTSLQNAIAVEDREAQELAVLQRQRQQQRSHSDSTQHYCPIASGTAAGIALERAVAHRFVELSDLTKNELVPLAKLVLEEQFRARASSQRSSHTIVETKSIMSSVQGLIKQYTQVLSYAFLACRRNHQNAELREVVVDRPQSPEEQSQECSGQSCSGQRSSPQTP